MSTVEAPASHLPLPMQNILSRLAANSTEAEQALVRKAYAYAAAAHAGQVRLSGEPYLSHPLAVAEVLAELGFDAIRWPPGCCTIRSRTRKSRSKRLTPSSANRSPTSWTA